MVTRGSAEGIFKCVNNDLEKVREGMAQITNTERDFPELSGMLCYILSGGKFIRPALVIMSSKFSSSSDEPNISMAIATELLHMATLVHDDAIDKADKRHGHPTVNSQWGLEKAILLGDYLFSVAGTLTASTGSLRVMRLFSNTLKAISRGELKQSFAAFQLDKSYSDYLERITQKTSSLFVMATESGSVLSQTPEEIVQALHDYGYNMGIAYQIVDDILDFTGAEEELGKPTGSDLSQGTITLPAMMLLERYPENNPIKLAFQGYEIADNLRKATEMIISSGIIDECYHIADSYAQKASKDLDKLPDNIYKSALLDLTRFVVQRKE